jgi:uncharacterized small protein (DUF1192 family)
MPLRDDDDPSLTRPRAGTPDWPPQDLSPLSVEELRRIIGHMQAEISRLESAIEAKQSHRDAAANLFKR